MPVIPRLPHRACNIGKSTDGHPGLTPDASLQYTYSSFSGARPSDCVPHKSLPAEPFRSTGNSMKLRSWSLWVISFFLVAFAAVYQRMTGPTYPLSCSATIGGSELHFRLLRSSGNPGDEEIRLSVPDAKIGGFIELRRFRSNDPWTRQELQRQGNELAGRIPHQPPAGKVAYKIGLSDGTQQVWLTAEPVIIRFKGDVPPAIMIPHIVLMFLAMLFSTRAGFQALLKRTEYSPERTIVSSDVPSESKILHNVLMVLGTMFSARARLWALLLRANLAQLALWTAIALGLGGIVLGPIVQKIAFGAFWTGWPFGHDLTDDKTAAAFLLWVVALWRLHRNPNARGWALAASVVLFAIYMIPHSVLGSELDYTQMPPPKG